MRRIGQAGVACAVSMLALLAAQSASAAVTHKAGATPVPNTSGSAKPTADMPPGSRVVSYHGVQVTVPASWPVIDLQLHPRTCVRLDQTAVYLGSPGPDSDCPAHAVGRVDTIWLRTVSGAQAAQAAPLTSGAATVGALAAHVGVDPVGHDKQAHFIAQGVDLDATWGADSSSIDRVLATTVSSSGSSSQKPQALSPAAKAPVPSHSVSAATPVPPHSTPAAVPVPSRSASAAALPASPGAALSAITGGTTFKGMGFDTCAAPSISTMRAWLRSPYRAAGVYIGGSMRACGDGNLSASWVSQVHAIGWRLIPTYVGPQAPCVSASGLAAISRTAAASQGAANAVDAVSRARYFGMGPGTPIYYDMEGYNPSSSCSRTVTTFMSAWTSQLHRLGYKSGGYGSPGSLMTDLVRSSATRGFAVPDNVWFANWNGRMTTSGQSGYPGFPDSAWKYHQRVHQYAGNLSQTWGSARVSIDVNYVDGGVAGTPTQATAPPVTGRGGFSGDFTGDGRSDLIGITPAGAMYLYRGNGTGGFTGAAVRIGTGWGTYAKVFSPGDFTGDGKTDLIGITPAGAMYLFRGNGTGGFTGHGARIGRGWGTYAKVFSPGDYTGDHKSDLIGITPAGAMYLFRGTGTGGFNGIGARIGTGWGSFHRVL